jgi:uncharacterized protein with FMN-binding domain
MKKLLSLLMVISSLIGFSAIADVYQTPQQFVESVFSSQPKKHAFWLKSEHKSIATDILGHKPTQLRFRYFGDGNKTAWVLDEIGKEQPITVGIEVQNNQIIQLKVLEYRENRGYEVRFPFFTDQFIGAALNQEQNLTQDIDGISGATMSVSALKRLARLALYLHKHTPYSHVETAQKN